MSSLGDAGQASGAFGHSAIQDAVQGIMGLMQRFENLQSQLSRIPPAELQKVVQEGQQLHGRFNKLIPTEGSAPTASEDHFVAYHKDLSLFVENVEHQLGITGPVPPPLSAGGGSLSGSGGTSPGSFGCGGVLGNGGIGAGFGHGSNHGSSSRSSISSAFGGAGGVPLQAVSDVRGTLAPSSGSLGNVNPSTSGSISPATDQRLQRAMRSVVDGMQQFEALHQPLRNAPQQLFNDIAQRSQILHERFVMLQRRGIELAGDGNAVMREMDAAPYAEQLELFVADQAEFVKEVEEALSRQGGRLGGALGLGNSLGGTPGDAFGGNSGSGGMGSSQKAGAFAQGYSGMVGNGLPVPPTLSGSADNSGAAGSARRAPAPHVPGGILNAGGSFNAGPLAGVAAGIQSPLGTGSGGLPGGFGAGSAAGVGGCGGASTQRPFGTITGGLGGRTTSFPQAQFGGVSGGLGGSIGEATTNLVQPSLGSSFGGGYDGGQISPATDRRLSAIIKQVVDTMQDFESMKPQVAKLPAHLVDPIARAGNGLHSQFMALQQRGAAMAGDGTKPMAEADASSYAHAMESFHKEQRTFVDNAKAALQSSQGAAPSASGQLGVGMPGLGAIGPGSNAGLGSSAAGFSLPSNGASSQLGPRLSQVHFSGTTNGPQLASSAGIVASKMGESRLENGLDFGARDVSRTLSGVGCMSRSPSGVQSPQVTGLSNAGSGVLPPFGGLSGATPTSVFPGTPLVVPASAAGNHDITVLASSSTQSVDAPSSESTAGSCPNTAGDTSSCDASSVSYLKNAALNHLEAVSDAKFDPAVMRT